MQEVMRLNDKLDYQTPGDADPPPPATVLELCTLLNIIKKKIKKDVDKGGDSTLSTLFSFRNYIFHFF